MSSSYPCEQQEVLDVDGAKNAPHQGHLEPDGYVTDDYGDVRNARTGQLRNEERGERMARAQRLYGQAGRGGEGPTGGSPPPTDDLLGGDARRRAQQVLMNLRPTFAVLQLPPTLIVGEVRRQYRRLALLLHPDKGGSAAEFRQAKEACNKIEAALGDLHRRFPELA